MMDPQLENGDDHVPSIHEALEDDGVMMEMLDQMITAKGGGE